MSITISPLFHYSHRRALPRIEGKRKCSLQVFFLAELRDKPV